MGAAEVRGVPDPPRGREGDVGLDAEPAKGAVPFLYKEVLGEPLPWLEGVESAKRPERLPMVLTREEVESILAASERHGGIDDPPPLRDGDAAHGACAPGGEGCRFRKGRDRGPAGQGWKGLHDCAAADPSQPDQRAPSARSGTLEADLEAGYGEVYLPDAVAASIQARHGTGRGSMRFPRARAPWTRVPGRCSGTMWTRRRCSARCSKAVQGGRRQAGHAAYAATFVCHPPPGVRWVTAPNGAPN